MGGTNSIISDNISKSDFLITVICSLISIISIPLIIYAPSYADKVFPFVFKKKLVITSDKKILLFKQETIKDEIILNDDIEVSYCGSRVIDILLYHLWWSRLIIKNKNSRDNDFKHYSITKNQYTKLIQYMEQLNRLSK